MGLPSRSVATSCTSTRTRLPVSTGPLWWEKCPKTRGPSLKSTYPTVAGDENPGGMMLTVEET